MILLSSGVRSPTARPLGTPGGRARSTMSTTRVAGVSLKAFERPRDKKT